MIRVTDCFSRTSLTSLNLGCRAAAAAGGPRLPRVAPALGAARRFADPSHTYIHTCTTRIGVADPSLTHDSDRRRGSESHTHTRLVSRAPVTMSGPNGDDKRHRWGGCAPGAPRGKPTMPPLWRCDCDGAVACEGGGGGFLSRSQFGFRQPQGVFHPVTESQKRVDGGPRRAPFEAEQSRNARTREADLECLQLLVIRFHKLWNWKFTLQIYFFKSTPDSCFVLLGTHQWCPVLRDTFFFGMLCVAKPF